MPRAARVVLPKHPHHVMQRGHNREVVFAEAADYQYYLDTLQEWKEQLGCKVYAYCLMTNHVHLVIDPRQKPTHLGMLIKRVAGRYTRYINKKEGRTGTLWESRYKSSPINTSEYLLSCCRYIEMNPVRAGLTKSPEQYRWSSYRKKAGIEEQDWVDEDAQYLGLGSTRKARQQRYQAWMRETVSDEEQELIRQAVRRNQLTGSSRFVDQVQRKLGRRIEFRGQGRPLKAKK